MIDQKNRIISRLDKYRIKYQVVSDNLITVSLLYVDADIVIDGEKFRLEHKGSFFSKNFKRDMKRLKYILREIRVVNRIESLEYFENKYRS